MRLCAHKCNPLLCLSVSMLLFPHSLQEFRSGGFKDALRHYTRSVALHPMTAALNNRALTCESLETSFNVGPPPCECTSCVIFMYMHTMTNMYIVVYVVGISVGIAKYCILCYCCSYACNTYCNTYCMHACNTYCMHACNTYSIVLVIHIVCINWYSFLKWCVCMFCISRVSLLQCHPLKFGWHCCV